MSIVVASYEGPQWGRLAPLKATALASARQFGVPVVDYHHPGDDIATARNGGLDQVTTEWVVHLDADDELDSGYLDAMAKGKADVRAPAAVWLGPNQRPNAATRARRSVPRVSGHGHECVAECLAYGNWLVVGSMVRTELAQRLRWRNWPCYEDWDLWLRCHLAGATFEAIPEALYIAHSQRGGRNSAMHIRDRNEVHHQIAEANGVLASWR